MSPFLVGLTLGGLAGFALGPVVVRLFRLLALVAVGAAVWLLAQGGLPSLEASLSTATAWLGPHAATVGGAAVGSVLGGLLAGLLPQDREDGC